jgi:hypothetical protein
VARQRVRGAKGTAAAVVAMAALTASQAPEAVSVGAAQPVRQAASGEHGPSVSGDTPYRTELPPLRAKKGVKEQGAKTSQTGAALPASVFDAYRRAEERLSREVPGCRLRWQLLAAIGQVESGQARGGRVASDGTTVTPILGPRLDGGAFAVIQDSDDGAYDGDPAYDRAVGPMQFIPSTWARWGADGNGDGRADPNNVFDAALAAGRYLCAGGRNLSDSAELDRAILGYNHSAAYLRTVRAWYAYFLEGHRVVPDSSAKPRAHAEPSHRPSGTPKPAPTPSARPTPTPTPEKSASPSPAPTTARPTTAPTATQDPQLPVPEPDIELPDEGPLTGDGPLTSGGADPLGQ